MKLKFSEWTPQTWLLVGALLVLGLVLWLIARGRKGWSAKRLSCAALCLALSFVLSYIRLFKLPQGGSVTPASMLPVMAFSYVFGVKAGLLVGIAYGLMQFLQSPEFLTLTQMLLDYPLAFACLGLCGIGALIVRRGGKDKLIGWLIGVFIAAAARFVCHTVSGAVFFAEYAAGTGQTPLIYSLVYNLFVFADAAVCAVVIAVPQVRKALARMKN